MAVQQDYARLPVFYNGDYLNQLTSVSHTTDSGQQPVNLLNEGLGGFTPGTGMCKMKIGFAIPIGGTEKPYQQDCANGAYVDLQLGVGEVSYKGRGKIITVEIGQSVNAAAEGTADWEGEFLPMS